MYFVFFFKQKTAYEIYQCDWSSDVCSSDLFNRYRTLDVIRGVVEAGAEERVTLYTGNDDHIVGDLLTPFTTVRDDRPVTIRIKGGLLGHWSVWTRCAVELLERLRGAVAADAFDLLALDARVTDMNGALFDVANGYAGCIPGCHEVLRRQGLLEGTWCLDPGETLSPGQAGEIDRGRAAYPELTDDDFVAANLERWLGEGKRPEKTFQKGRGGG